MNSEGRELFQAVLSGKYQLDGHELKYRLASDLAKGCYTIHTVDLDQYVPQSIYRKASEVRIVNEGNITKAFEELNI